MSASARPARSRLSQGDDSLSFPWSLASCAALAQERASEREARLWTRATESSSPSVGKKLPVSGCAHPAKVRVTERPPAPGDPRRSNGPRPSVLPARHGLRDVQPGQQDPHGARLALSVMETIAVRVPLGC